MGAETIPESADVQEGAYIEGLREFFAGRNVPFGAPEDLITLAARVSEEEPLREEMSSVLRAIVHCEGEQLSRGQLMRLVVVAGGGPTVSPTMAELQSALWQIARWVNTAFEQDENVSSQEVAREPAASEPNVTAGEGVAAETRAQAQATEPASRQRLPRRGFGFLRPIPKTTRQGSAPEGGKRAKRKFRMGAKGNGWVLPAVVFLAAAGVLAYLTWPSWPHTFAARSGDGAAKTAGASGQGSNAAAASSASSLSRVGPRLCVGPVRGGVSRAGVEERSLWAHKLLDQKLYEVALPQLRGLEAANPGYPGVALDESEALLGMGQLDGARGAIDAQVRVSACLASLPSAAIDAYCREEFASADIGSCRPAMARIQAATELQAALVHLQLANRMQPEERTSAALADLARGGAAAAHREDMGSRSGPGGAVASGEGPARVDGIPAPTAGDTISGGDHRLHGRRLERTSSP